MSSNKADNIFNILKDVDYKPQVCAQANTYWGIFVRRESYFTRNNKFTTTCTNQSKVCCNFLHGTFVPAVFLKIIWFMLFMDFLLYNWTNRFKCALNLTILITNKCKSLLGLLCSLFIVFFGVRDLLYSKTIRETFIIT